MCILQSSAIYMFPLKMLFIIREYVYDAFYSKKYLVFSKILSQNNIANRYRIYPHNIQKSIAQAFSFFLFFTFLEFTTKFEAKAF